MNIFLDTNIYLSFLHFSNDDLDELDKLTIILKKGDDKLFVTEQVINEFNRNREMKIADAMKLLKDQNLNLRFPQFCKQYEELSQLRDLQRDYSKIHSALIQKAIADIQSQNLKADQIIFGLFKIGKNIQIEGQIFDLAQRRLILGNPPGKNGSIGDAINWEILLENVPSGEDIYFISDDKDFGSPLFPEIFNKFLLTEWMIKKKSNIHFYKSLSQFFKEHYPNINLEDELDYEKTNLIQDLANSPHFANTHEIVGKLNQFSNFSIEQINQILSATLSNRQIYWIIEDSDINAFLKKLLEAMKMLLIRIT